MSLGRVSRACDMPPVRRGNKSLSYGLVHIMLFMGQRRIFALQLNWSAPTLTSRTANGVPSLTHTHMDISTKAILCRDGQYGLDDLWDADRCQLHSKKKGRIGVIIAYMRWSIQMYQWLPRKRARRTPKIKPESTD